MPRAVSPAIRPWAAVFLVGTVLTSLGVQLAHPELEARWIWTHGAVACAGCWLYAVAGEGLLRWLACRRGAAGLLCVAGPLLVLPLWLLAGYLAIEVPQEVALRRSSLLCAFAASVGAFCFAVSAWRAGVPQRRGRR